jgi:hypothetical protein
MEPRIELGIFIARGAGGRAMNIGAIPEPPERCVEYRQRAAECRSLAYDVFNEGSREELLALAEVWMRLADDARPVRPQ